MQTIGPLKDIFKTACKLSLTTLSKPLGKMADEREDKDASSAPLTKTPKSQLTAEQLLIQKARTYQKRDPKTKKSRNEIGGGMQS